MGGAGAGPGRVPRRLMGLWLFLCGGVAFLASSIALCPGELIKQRSEPPTPNAWPQRQGSVKPTGRRIAADFRGGCGGDGRLQTGMYSSIGQGIASIWRSEGLLGFYQGYGSICLRDVPFTMLELCALSLAPNLPQLRSWTSIEVLC